MLYRTALALLVCDMLTSLAGAASGLWLDVPFVRQGKNGCGAAAIWMVQQYWADKNAGHAPIPEVDSIQRELYSPDARGIYASAMQRYFRQRQFRTFTFEGTLADLREHLAKGRPLIVALKESAAALHYVVVAGIDEQQGLVLVNDPAQRKLLKSDLKDFQRAWAGAHHWTLLALPPADQ